MLSPFTPSSHPLTPQLNAPAIALFVRQFGLDGVDIDFEASTECGRRAGGHVACTTDGTYIGAVLALRRALPRPALLTAAVWSVGAYGEGAWADAQPRSANTGMSLNMLRRAGGALDWLFAMTYDAGSVGTTGFDPKVRPLRWRRRQ